MVLTISKTGKDEKPRTFFRTIKKIPRMLQKVSVSEIFEQKGVPIIKYIC